MRKNHTQETVELQKIEQEIQEIKMELEEKYLYFGKLMCEQASRTILETNKLVDQLIQLKKKKAQIEGGHPHE